MQTLLLGLSSILAIIALSLFGWRLSDHHSDREEINRLRLLQPATPQYYQPDMVAKLPEPVQRYFNYTISEGAQLAKVTELQMQGKFALGTREQPNYIDFSAQQVLAVPHGFVWKMSGASGLMRISGSDSGKWTRFWLGGVAPVARSGGSDDHTRSAFGRYVSEAIFWSPAALLPGNGVAWEAINNNTARCTIKFDGLEQSVDLTIDHNGQPTQVVFMRWSDANAEKRFQLQPFGGTFSGFKEFNGYRLPTHVEAGNFFGTDAYFPFFIAEVTGVKFP